MGVLDPMTGVMKTVEKLNPWSGDESQDKQGDARESAEQGRAPEAASSAEELSVEAERPVEDTEQVRVERAEEELEVEKAKRETGSVGVSKTVEAKNVDVAVPVRREEVHVERVPVDESTDSASIGEEVVRVPVYEEETVVTKRPVVKEEILVSKEMHTDVEHVAENVRKEHVEVDESSSRS